MEIVQAVKTLNSISREGLNFWRRPILCTTLYRNLMHASNFGSTFDQLFLRIFYKILQKMPLYVFYTWCKKIKNDQKLKSRGPALNSISRGRLNSRRRPILCTTLYRNLMQASNFGGIFDQPFLWIFLWNFHRRCASTSSIWRSKKVKNDLKLKSRGSGLINIFSVTVCYFVITNNKLRSRNCRVLQTEHSNPRPQAESCMRGLKADNSECGGL